MDFYSPVPANFPTLRQGDLLADVPFAYFPLTDVRVRLANKRSAKRDLTQDKTNVEYLVAAVRFDWGIVMTQTCDLQPDRKTGNFTKPVTIARIRPIKTLVSDFRDDSLKSVIIAVGNLATEAKAPVIFYLPAYQDDQITLPRSGVDLLDVQRFEAKDIPALMRLARLRLSSHTQQAFQARCAYCYGRFAAPEGMYLSDEEYVEKQRLDDIKRQSQGW